MGNNTLNDILTFVIAVTMISATYLFIAPGLVTSETVCASIIDSKTVESTPEIIPEITSRHAKHVPIAMPTSTPVQVAVPEPTIIPTPIPTPTITPTVIVTPTPVKNAEMIRTPYIHQIPMSGHDEYMSIIITCGRYEDVEEQARREAETGYPHSCQYVYCVHPDLLSYNVYINGELRRSYSAPEIEDFDGRNTHGIYPRTTKDDYPMNLTIETEYIDGEIFTYTKEIIHSKPTPCGSRVPIDCGWEDPS